MTEMPPEVSDYLALVDEGPACKEQAQLAAMVRRVFAEESIEVDTGRLAVYMGYQKYFPWNLLPWEKFIFTLHNCVFDADGRPRFPDLFVLCGRGAGKNGYLAFQAFCQMTSTHGVPNYDIDICAMSEDQARTSFDELHDLFERSTGKDYVRFRKHFHWNKTEIKNLDTGSVLKFRANNPKGRDGLRSGAVYFDEVHAYTGWENINVFTTGLGKKSCPRRTYVTTNGDVRDGVLDKMVSRAGKVLSGEEPDAGFLPFICKLDSPDEVSDPEMWAKANPSLTAFPELRAQIEREYEEYKLDPNVNTAFMTKRMNVPQGRHDIEVTSWDNLVRASRALPDLEGAPCVCGIDFAKTTDFISAVLLFHVGEEYQVLHHSWYCTESHDRDNIKLPLDEMERRGILTIVDDVEVAPADVVEWVDAQRDHYNVQKVAIDSYRLSLMSAALRRAGFTYKERTLKLTRPSDIMRTQPVINSAFARDLIVWGDDPMMRWYTHNAKLEPAANNNWTFGKIEPHGRKTDGFMAMVAAFTIADAIPEDYELEFFEPIVF